MNVRLPSSFEGSGTTGPVGKAPPLVWTSALTPPLSPQEKEKLYMELRHILARQPGPEAAEQLQIYRHTLRERTKQLKVSGRPCSRVAGQLP